MKKFLLKISGFGVLSIFLFLLSILATEIEFIADLLSYKIPLSKGTTSHQWTRLGEADTTKNVDVLILGSSVAQSVDVRGFQKFNLKAFNLASGSQTPIQTSYLLDKYLDSFNPRLVIWDVNPYTFIDTGVESTIDLVSNCQFCDGMVFMLFKTNSSLAWNYYFKRMMLKPFENDDFTAPRETKISKYISGGYMETFLEAPASPVQTSQFEFKSLAIQKRTFESELTRLNNKAIPIIMIYSPRSTHFIQNFLNQEEWFSYYNSMIDRGLAEKFLNLNEIFSDDSANRSNFVDFGHLTVNGLDDYNKVLIDSLSDILENLNIHN